MRRFECVCGQPLYFENSACLACGRQVAFSPPALAMMALEPATVPDRARLCSNRWLAEPCNWLLPERGGPGTRGDLCLSCRMTVMVPPLEQGDNLARWGRLERAKRRLVYDLLRLGLPIDGPPVLEFAFLEDQRTNPAVTEAWVLTGYRAGRITIHSAEADDVFRETQRALLRQPWRSLLGHFRHEAGHYYFERLVAPDPARLQAFRRLFGDERRDYADALAGFYAGAAAEDWRDGFLTAYGQVHPLEDWAEGFEHLLHADDVMETAQQLGLLPRVDRAADPASFFRAWRGLAVALNELNRSLGLSDAYPFVLTSAVEEKLAFIGSVLRSAADPTPPAAAR